jgi:hypothetical protein
LDELLDRLLAHERGTVLLSLLDGAAVGLEDGFWLVDGWGIGVGFI